MHARKTIAKSQRPRLSCPHTARTVDHHLHPELDSLFRELLASNRGPGYGISVLAATPDLSVIDVDFRFLAGRSYCCAEPGCHLDHSGGRLLRLAKERSIPLPNGVTVRWHCYVEQGARLECMKFLRLPTESEAYDFEYVSGVSSPPQT
jgi:hypothetical protein